MSAVATVEAAPSRLESVGVYIAKGLPVIEAYGVGPDGTCQCPKAKNCSTPGKHPRGKEWQKAPALSVADVAAILETRPRANFGIRTGSGIIGVDVELEGKDSGVAMLAAGQLTATLVTRTGGGGQHLIYQLPAGVVARNSQSAIAPKVDIRGENGFLVIGGSVSSKGTYAIQHALPVAEAPAALVGLIAAPERPSLAPVPSENAPVAEVGPEEAERRRRYFEPAIRAEVAVLDAMTAAATPDGRDYRGRAWDGTTFEVACKLLDIADTPGSGLTHAEAERLVLDHAPQDTNWGRAEVEAKILSARSRASAGQGRVVPERRGSDLDEMFGPAPAIAAASPLGMTDAVVNPAAIDDGVLGVMSDANVADAFVRAVAGRILFCRGLGWLRWDGCRWTEVDKAEVLHNSKEFAQWLVNVANRSGEEGRIKAAAQRTTSAKIEAVIKLAEGNPAIRVDISELDSDPFLLNCANGTLDLRTRTLRPHDPSDRLTKITIGAYVGPTGPTEWDAFLAQILPDEAERAYLQRVVGQAIYGRVREHLFPVLTGTGANGKGTAYGAVVHALGEYGAVIDPEVLMARERGGIGGPEMMVLRGARLVVGSETGEGRKLDESTMKRLTGGDALTARHLYKPVVIWQPSHQLVYVTNNLPTVKGNDPAVWRRMRIIPFDVVVPAERRDTKLGERLALLADAVLSWVVAGWFAYEDLGGMHEPDSVLLATGNYQVDSDAVARFIRDECETGPHWHEGANHLYIVWQRWAISEGAEPMAEKAFAAELDRLGHEKRRTSRGYVREGLRLPEEARSG